MAEAWQVVKGGAAPILIIADHASAHVPADIDLGIDDALLRDHIALDIGVAEVSVLLARQLGCTAILGGISRLVIDLNRELHSPGLVPLKSDGHVIPGNQDADVAARIARFHAPYHDKVAELLRAMEQPFILSLHSFTPGLTSSPDEIRPWQIGILYNEDDRAARIAIPLLEAAGLCVGDQLPYSGKTLNATMNRHAEADDIAYLGVEMRQDQVAGREGQARFAAILEPVVRACAERLA